MKPRPASRSRLRRRRGAGDGATLKGPLPLHARTEFEQHLVSCPGCVIYLRQIQAQIAAAASLAAERPAPEEVKRKLLAMFRASRGIWNMMAWKFLAPVAIAPSRALVGRFRGVRTRVNGCRVGQAKASMPVALGDLPYWLDDELWEVELDAPIFRAAPPSFVAGERPPGHAHRCVAGGAAGIHRSLHRADPPPRGGRARRGRPWPGGGPGQSGAGSECLAGPRRAGGRLRTVRASDISSTPFTGGHTPGSARTSRPTRLRPSTARGATTRSAAPRSRGSRTD